MHRIARVLFLAACLFVISFFKTAYAVKPDFFDPRSSEHQSGVKTPREYFLPPVPAYEHLDPSEFQDLDKAGRTASAVLMIFHPVQSGQTKIPAGYYLVKKTPTELIIKQSGEIKLRLPIAKFTVEGQTKRKITKASWIIDSENALNPQVLYLQYCDPIGCYKTGRIEPGLVE